MHPFAGLYLKYRVMLGKEDGERYAEKLGEMKLIHFCNPMQGGGDEGFNNPLWFHTASVGELQAIIPLLKVLREEDDASPILITTCTKTGYDIFMKAGIERSAHCYAPIDTPQAVHAFLKFWKPKLAVFVESEIWPNMLKQTKSVCKVLLCNARMSSRSFMKWRRVAFIFRNLMQCFTNILASTEETYDKLIALGVSRVEYAGNLKYASPPLPCNMEEFKKFSGIIGDRHVLLAASTHAPEEDMIISIYNKLLKNIPDLFLIIVPRHPERSQEIAGLLRGMKYVVRSQSTMISSTTSVYLADTVGELGLFYRLASLVFVGGSMMPHGGQNMLEPARLGCAIIVGPYTFNFNDIMETLIKKNAIMVATSDDDLLDKVDDLLLNEDECKTLAANAFAAAKVQEDSLEKNLFTITNAYRWTT